MLARHQVSCVVIGGYAAVLAGVEIITRDVDITPATDPENLHRLAAALNELHAAIRVRPGRATRAQPLRRGLAIAWARNRPARNQFH